MCEKAPLNAWMIRKDGERIPCLQHIYANADELYETLYAAQWLYQNTLDKKAKELVVRLILRYGAMQNERRGPFENIYLDIKSKPYVFLTKAFVYGLEKALSGEIERYYSGKEELKYLCQEVEKRLNSEFLRARYGGLYHTVKGKKAYIFASLPQNGFDWMPIIRAFITDFDREVYTISVVSDEESTGKCFFYNAPNEKPIDQMPVCEFLSAVQGKTDVFNG